MLNGDHNNFGPRFGLAYQLRPKLVIRTGYGIFFGDSDRNSSSHLQGSQIPNVPIITAPVVDPQRTVTPPYTLSTPIKIEPYQPDLKAFSAANPIVRTFFAPDLLHTVSPYLQQYSFSIQYEAARNWLLETSYEGSKGTKLGDRINLNQEPFEYALDGRNTQANRRYPFINGLFAYDQSTATSNYNSVNFKVERRFSSGLAFLVNYSIQKTLERGVPGVIGTFTQNGGTSLPLDSYNTQREIAYSPLDVPQTLVASYSYELPIGPAQEVSRRPRCSRKNRGRLDGGRHHQHARRLPDRCPLRHGSAQLRDLQRSGSRLGPAGQSAESRAGPVLQSGRFFRAADGAQQHRRADSDVRQLRQTARARPRLE